jgi:hypothetical protein
MVPQSDVMQFSSERMHLCTFFPPTISTGMGGMPGMGGMGGMPGMGGTPETPSFNC